MTNFCSEESQVLFIFIKSMKNSQQGLEQDLNLTGKLVDMKKSLN